MDGVDAVLCEFEGPRFRSVRSTHSVAYPADLRQRLLRLQREAGAISLADYAACDNAVADSFAEAALPLCRAGGVTAVGSHGQTVFHGPQGVQSSLQIGNPARLAVRLGLPVVADFRRADVALGGQGAPLVPAFHHAVFSVAQERRAVLNLGGIANITLLPGTDPAQVTGWDTGPANALLDEWVQQQQGRAQDDNGAWAAQGRVQPALLEALLADPYFQRLPPKSTGRDVFNLDWVRRRFPALDSLPPVDVQRSLLELTVESVARALAGSGVARLLVCGGGALNRFLMQTLAARLAPLGVESTAVAGLAPMQVEGAAFAWLACRRWEGLPGNLPAVTGASRPAVLGGLYLP